MKFTLKNPLTTLQSNLHNLTEFAAQLLFPANCIACNKVATPKVGTICVDCFKQMHFLSAPECSQCGEPFEYDAGLSICDVCETNPPQYDSARALWAYDDCSSDIVKRFKFADKTHFAKYLSELMQARGFELIARADIIAPVPLHHKRMRERRYNQAALLCTHLAHNNPEKLVQNLLIRTRYTTAQTELPFKQRQENVAGVFALNPNYASHISGKNILLIDDVLTTGATVNACADTLKKQGCSRVDVLTITKRLRD